MVNFTLRKLLGMIPMLLIITFLIYAGIELMPGDVIDFLIPMDQLAEMTAEEVAAFRAAKGLDGPMIVRYFNWLIGVCKGDLGYSLQNNMPVAQLMMQKEYGDSTVTVCHSRSANLKEECRQADIIIAAIGRPGFVTADMVKPGAVIIDVGTTRVPDATRKNGFRLSGDVDFENVAPLCSAITPVPGGVGPMTICMLMLNTLAAAKHEYYK